MPVRFPDNTLEGFAAAAEVVGMVELDVRRSLDGYRVLAHDPDIGGLDIATTPWAELALVELADPAGQGGYHPVRLDDVFAAIPELALDIEIKNTPGDPGFDPTFEFAVEVGGMARPIDVVTSFFWPTMDAVKAHHPEVRTGLLIDGSGSIRDGVRHALDVGHQLVAPHWSLLVAEPSLDFVLETGLAIATWTVNDEVTAIRLSDAGVGTIITDDPQRLSEALVRARGQETP